jgi:hypothetical protein
MYLPYRSTRQVFQEIMVRKARDVGEWVNKNLDSTERYGISPDPNGLGFRVGILSRQAKELLLRLHREVFSSGFVEPKPWLEDNGVWTAWFGYVEPWEHPSVHFLPMQ